MTRLPWRALLVVLGLVLLGGTYCAGKERGQKLERLRTDEAVAKAAQVVRDSAGRASRAALQAVAQGKPALAASRRAAGIVGPTTVVVRETVTSPPDTVEVPHVVVQRLVEDSLNALRLEGAVAALRLELRADTVLIRAQAVVIKDLKAIGHPRCGRRCGMAIGAGVVVAGAWGLNQIRGR